MRNWVAGGAKVFCSALPDAISNFAKLCFQLNSRTRQHSSGYAAA